MTFDKEGLASLLKRVKAATGPDQILDLAIADALLEYQERKQARIRLGYNFTASIDASLALVERLLPGWEYVLEGSRRPSCVLLHPDNEEGEWVFVETAPSLPLAIVLSLLTALKEVVMGKLTKADIEVLRRANDQMRDTILPWRGTIQRCWRLARDGYLVEAGISVMPPHKLYAITPAGRAALEASNE